MTNNWPIHSQSGRLIEIADRKLWKYLPKYLPHSNQSWINKEESLLRSAVILTSSLSCVWRIASESGVCDRSKTDRCAARFWVQYNSRNYPSNRRSSHKASRVNSWASSHPSSVNNSLSYHPILIFLKVCVLINKQLKNVWVYDISLGVGELRSPRL